MRKLSVDGVEEIEGKIKNLKELVKYNEEVGILYYRVNKQDLETTSYIAHLIEHSRSDTTPMIGDVIICKGLRLTTITDT